MLGPRRPAAPAARRQPPLATGRANSGASANNNNNNNNNININVRSNISATRNKPAAQAALPPLPTGGRRRAPTAAEAPAKGARLGPGAMLARRHSHANVEGAAPSQAHSQLQVQVQLQLQQQQQQQQRALAGARLAGRLVGANHSLAAKVSRSLAAQQLRQRHQPPPQPPPAAIEAAPRQSPRQPASLLARARRLRGAPAAASASRLSLLSCSSCSLSSGKVKRVKPSSSPAAGPAALRPSRSPSLGPAATMAARPQPGSHEAPEHAARRHLLTRGRSASATLPQSQLQSQSQRQSHSQSQPQPQLQSQRQPQPQPQLQLQLRPPALPLELVAALQMRRRRRCAASYGAAAAAATADATVANGRRQPSASAASSQPAIVVVAGAAAAAQHDSAAPVAAAGPTQAEPQLLSPADSTISPPDTRQTPAKLATHSEPPNKHNTRMCIGSPLVRSAAPTPTSTHSPDLIDIISTSAGSTRPPSPSGPLFARPAGLGANHHDDQLQQQLDNLENLDTSKPCQPLPPPPPPPLHDKDQPHLQLTTCATDQFSANNNCNNIHTNLPPPPPLRDQSIAIINTTSTAQSTTSPSPDNVHITICDEPIGTYYDLEARPFARGKFAQVKRCVNKATKQCFAAKCIKKRRRLVDIRHEIMLEIEALKLSYFTERIVKLYQVYETPTEMILVLEMATGGELQRVLDEDEVVEESLARKIVIQLLEGLVYLHDNNIVHLDIKPQNVLLTNAFPNSDVKLCDFGLSRKISQDCEIREICGTPDYVAPEILRYDPISLFTDMWSLGVLTYVLLSGYSPFGSDDKQQTMSNITQSPLDFPEEIFVKISPQAIDFISKLIVREPQDRLTSRQARLHEWLCQPERQDH